MPRNASPEAREIVRMCEIRRCRAALPHDHFKYLRCWWYGVRSKALVRIWGRGARLPQLGSGRSRAGRGRGAVREALTSQTLLPRSPRVTNTLGSRNSFL